MDEEGGEERGGEGRGRYAHKDTYRGLHVDTYRGVDTDTYRGAHLCRHISVYVQVEPIVHRDEIDRDTQVTEATGPTDPMERAHATTVVPLPPLAA